MATSTVEKLNPTRVKIVITADKADLEPSVKHAYEHIAEQVSIPGFRKGKVPAAIIDQRVGRGEVLNHAVNDSLDRLYQEALAEHDLRPLSRPEADVKSLPSEKDFSGDLVIEVEVEIRPEFELPNVEKIKISVDNAEASADEIQNELDELRARFGTTVVADRPAKTGDLVQLNLVAEIDGVEVDAADDITYEVGSGELLAGIDEALDTLTAGEETTFESELMGGEHEGKKALVKVEVLHVKERQLPEADDEFAQVASQFDTLAELKDDLKNTVIASKKFEQFSQARTKLIDALIENTELPISEKVIQDEVHRHLEQENRLDDDEHRKEVEESSEKMLKQQLILDKIADERDVQVGQDEFGRFIMQSAAQYGIDPNEYVKLLDQQGQVPALVADIARNKAVSSLLGELKVTDAEGTVLDFSEYLPAVEEAEAVTDEASSEETVAEEPKKGAKKPAAKKTPKKKED